MASTTDSDDEHSLTKKKSALVSPAMRALAQRVIVSLLPLLAQPTAAWRPLLTRRQLSVAILSAVPLPAAANGLGDELGQLVSPVLDAGKQPSSMQADAEAAVDRIKREGLIVTTGKEVPAPLIAFVVLGGAAATASFVFDRRGGAVGPEAAPAEEGEPWVSSFAAPPDAACEDEEECVLPDMD